MKDLADAVIVGWGTGSALCLLAGIAYLAVEAL